MSSFRLIVVSQTRNRDGKTTKASALAGGLFQADGRYGDLRPILLKYHLSLLGCRRAFDESRGADFDWGLPYDSQILPLAIGMLGYLPGEHEQVRGNHPRLPAPPQPDVYAGADGREGARQQVRGPTISTCIGTLIQDV